MEGPDLYALTDRFRQPGVRAIVLAGSHARGDAGRFSDVDLLRFQDRGGTVPPPRTHLVGGWFVVVNDIGASEVETWFTEPESASTHVEGVRSARALWDPDRYFDAILRRANAFVRDEVMQEKADTWASGQMVGWIEEAQKGLEGLRRNDEGRLLNARHGLSWGLIDVMRVQRGVLVSGDNAGYPEVIQRLGRDSRWARLSRRAFGIANDVDLAGQVEAGLRLYVETAGLLGDALLVHDAVLVQEVVGRIKSELGGRSGRKGEP